MFKHFAQKAQHERRESGYEKNFYLRGRWASQLHALSDDK
jgi:hypothetical protein